MPAQDSDFMLAKEVEKDVRLSAVTIWRLQKKGLFPKYKKIGLKKNIAIRSEIAEYKRDPEGWAKRNPSGAAA